MVNGGIAFNNTTGRVNVINGATLDIANGCTQNAGITRVSGGTFTCGGCSDGLTCQGNVCAAPVPRCTTPRQCCLQAGGYWINNRCQ